MITACIECGRTKCKGCKDKLALNADKLVTIKKAYKIAKEMFGLERQEVGEYDYFYLDGNRILYEESKDIVKYTELGWANYCQDSITEHFANIRKAERAQADKEREKLLGKRSSLDSDK